MQRWNDFLYTPNTTQKIDYLTGTNPIYIGESVPGSSLGSPSWKIKKLTYDGNGNVTDVQWAPNYLNFGDIWNNRVGLVYS